ncbi:MAG: hypothetical protein M1499_06400, partial [Firmicutes bacterium]|nr:hypothetical protein [Bacillota bacterium]
MGLLTPDQLDQLYSQLKAAFTDLRALQFSTSSDFRTTGIGYPWIVDRLNTVLGLSHWRFDAHDLHVQELPGDPAHHMTASVKVTVEIGNPHYFPETGHNAWEVLATRFAYGTHSDPNTAIAIKGAVTN